MPATSSRTLWRFGDVLARKDREKRAAIEDQRVMFVCQSWIWQFTGVVLRTGPEVNGLPVLLVSDNFLTALWEKVDANSDR